MSCTRAQGYLAENDIAVRESVDAKAKLGRDEALRLAQQASEVIVAKGKKVVRFDMRRDPPDEKALLAAMLGPTGNLRAPTIRKGKTLLVGFNRDTYDALMT